MNSNTTFSLALEDQHERTSVGYQHVCFSWVPTNRTASVTHFVPTHQQNHHCDIYLDARALLSQSRLPMNKCAPRRPPALPHNDRPSTSQPSRLCGKTPPAHPPAPATYSAKAKCSSSVVVYKRHSSSQLNHVDSRRDSSMQPFPLPAVKNSAFVIPRESSCPKKLVGTMSCCKNYYNSKHAG